MDSEISTLENLTTYDCDISDTTTIPSLFFLFFFISLLNAAWLLNEGQEDPRCMRFKNCT